MNPPELGVSHHLRHLALVDPSDPAWQRAIPWSRAGLADQTKLGLLLQVAALMAHCQDQGLLFGTTQSLLATARVDARGLLKVDGCRPGRFGEPSQTLLARTLLELFDARHQIPGRGAPRKAANALLERWRQELVPQRPESLLAEILAAAPFLWSAAGANWRWALYAEKAAADGSWKAHLAATPAVRRRFFAAAQTREEWWALLGGPEARLLFEGSHPQGESPLEAAGHALDQGQFRRCLELLAQPDATAAAQPIPAPQRLLLRLTCQHALGDYHAAIKTWHQLSDADLPFTDQVELTEIANRLAGSHHDLAAVRRQTAALVAQSAQQPTREQGLAALVAAGAAWDNNDGAAMDQALAQALPVREDPRWGWRWQSLRGQRALLAGDGVAASQAFEKALGWRRRLRRHEAGRLWNDLAIARAMAGDLRAAERACLHAWQLLHRCDGPASITLALTNLAELRVRRGFFAGVAATLERSMVENRAAANARALLHDLLLAARLELGLGRPLAALARCAAVAELPAGKNHELAHLLAARALGWLGQAESAAAKMALGQKALAELEPEERPAVWALAGDLEAARREAHGQATEALWTAVLAAEPPPLPAWSTLDSLEKYRAARLVYDLELVFPGCSPYFRRNEASRTLRDAGATALASALDGTSGATWAEALQTYVAGPVDLERATNLLHAAGFGECQLRWVDPTPQAAAAVPPASPPRLASQACGRQVLVLEGPHRDPALLALFALIARDLGPAGNGNADAKSAVPGAPPSLRHAPGRVDRRDRADAGDRGQVDGIFGQSPALVAALDRLDRLANGTLPIYILGESGTGKEAMARRCHRLSPRRQGPFLAINCAALSESLILSDLFGHVRGAFTGADRDRAGLFEAARGGTVFLDEIGDLPLSCQGHLLRVLQESEIRRVGESISRKVDVRVITATHRDLAEEVEKGRFRQDLYFRLKVAKIPLPPLRERAGDILHLANHFLANAPGYPQPRPQLDAAAAAALEAYDWPGNIRELKNVLEVAMALADGGEISPEHLELPAVSARNPMAATTSERPFETAPETLRAKNAPSAAEPNENLSFHDQLDRFRRDLLTRTLEKCGGNRAAAARELGLTRQALSYLTRQLGMFQM